MGYISTKFHMLVTNNCSSNHHNNTKSSQSYQLTTKTEINYRFFETLSMQILKNIKKLIQQQSIILNKLIILGHFPRDQKPQLRIDRRQFLQIPVSHSTFKTLKHKTQVNK
ncbi:hypothetical protein HanXRQr2_Chr13g0568781 [Helianthus annuus]|uniref:Uncharacterized protein n=1 Tax=Helianthus annuus TaxID=4232 RepID=A0A9K3EFE9_HELAN|nr:hypothetical protein HanXRQr2_Chr13g0568781 [Helianthus annuus]